jgi:hypothetical protein
MDRMISTLEGIAIKRAAERGDAGQVAGVETEEGRKNGFLQVEDAKRFRMRLEPVNPRGGKLFSEEKNRRADVAADVEDDFGSRRFGK